MTSHHVTCHVTAMSRASSSLLKRKKKRNSKEKKYIKSRKIDKRKRKMLVSKAFHNKKSTLSPVLSALYIAPIFYIFKTRSKNLLKNLAILFLYFRDDDLFISQKKSFEKSNAIFFVVITLLSEL